MDRIGKDLLRDAKANIAQNGASKDLLSILVRANVESQSEKGGQTMTDDEVLARKSNVQPYDSLNGVLTIWVSEVPTVYHVHH
jgi:hypothetical protein